MWKSSSKQERGCAQVCWEVTASGWLELRLTTPTRSRAFFLRRSGARKVVTMATATCGDESTLTPSQQHREKYRDTQRRSFAAYQQRHFKKSVRSINHHSPDGVKPADIPALRPVSFARAVRETVD